MTLVLIGKDLVLKGSTTKIEDKQVPGMYCVNRKNTHPSRQNYQRWGTLLRILIVINLGGQQGVNIPETLQHLSENSWISERFSFSCYTVWAFFLGGRDVDNSLPKRLTLKSFKVTKCHSNKESTSGRRTNLSRYNPRGGLQKHVVCPKSWSHHHQHLDARMPNSHHRRHETFRKRTPT